MIGKGAFGEVRLVRMRERFSKEIYAMKSMLKEAMIMKNQVGHVRAERDILTESENPWIVMLYYTFQVITHLLLFNNNLLNVHSGRKKFIHGYGILTRRGFNGSFNERRYIS